VPIHARMRAALAGLDEGTFTEGHKLDRRWQDSKPATIAFAHTPPNALTLKASLHRSTSFLPPTLDARPGPREKRNAPWGRAIPRRGGVGLPGEPSRRNHREDALIDRRRLYKIAHQAPPQSTEPISGRSCRRLHASPPSVNGSPQPHEHRTMSNTFLDKPMESGATVWGELGG
jgi:hypothetical protein